MARAGGLAKTRRAETNFYQGELATNPLVLRCADMREADPERCRKKADECRVKADNADSPADKAAWRHLAQDWFNMYSAKITFQSEYTSSRG